MSLSFNFFEAVILAASSKYSVYIGVNEKANSGMHYNKVEIARASEKQKPRLIPLLSSWMNYLTESLYFYL